MTCQHFRIAADIFNDDTRPPLWWCVACKTRFEPVTKSATGKAYEAGRRAMLDEVLRIAPDSISVMLERLKEES